MFAFITGGGGGKKRGRGSGGGGGGGRSSWWGADGGGDEGTPGGASPAPGKGKAAAAATAGAPAGPNRHLSDIERKRQESILENQEFMKQLGLSNVLTDMRGGEGAGGASSSANAKPPGAAEGGGRQPRISTTVPAAAVPSLSMEDVMAKWVGREPQIKQLARLLPSPDDPVSASSVLLVHGPSGAGKTGVLTDLLGALRLPHALVRGVEHPTARSLYTTIAAAWLRYIEAQAQALGLEGLGYMEMDDYDEQREERAAARRARRNLRRRRRSRRKKRGSGAVKEGEEEEEEEEEDSDAGESSGAEEDVEEGSEDDEDLSSSSDEDEDDDDDPYFAQRSTLQQASSGLAGTNLVPLPSRCATAAGLLHLLRSWRGHQSREGEGTGISNAGTVPFVVILDSADRLPRGAAPVRHELVELPAMLAGPRGKSSDRGAGGAGAVVALTVILISETPTVAPGTLEAALALDVPFPAYSKAQATAILLRSLRVAAGLPAAAASSSSDEKEFESLVAGFVNVLVASLYSSTKDVREMRRMAVLLSEKYLEPVLAEKVEAAATDLDDEENNPGGSNSTTTTAATAAAAPGHTALFERVRPLIQRAVHSCLHMPAEPLEKAGLPTTGGAAVAAAAAASSSEAHQALLRHELPKMARYLLVASYLASHVAPETDLQLFSVKSSRSTKRTKREAAGQERANEAREAEAEKEGARTFSLERLLSIFTCLVALTRASGAAYANNTGTTELFAQVNTLVHHRFLIRVKGGPGELGAIKYKCNVDEDLVRVVAKDLELTLSQYLEGGRG